MANPMAYAHVVFIEGDQGSGKNTVAVARLAEKTFANITSIRLEDGRIIKATPTNPPRVGRAKIWLLNREPFVANVPPKSCAIADSVKIYANFHLYGIRASFMPLDAMIEYLNEGYINNGYVVCDEHYIGGSTLRTMSNLVSTIGDLGFQMRKRHVEFMMLAPYKRLVGYRNRSIVTEHIMCSYDEDKHEITITVRKKGERRSRTFPPFYAPYYWPYFNTDELIQIPQSQISKALASAR
jgi:hypothetical protein